MLTLLVNTMPSMHYYASVSCMCVQEFIKGMTVLKVDTVEKLKALLPSLDPGFMDTATFRELYRRVTLYHVNTMLYLNRCTSIDTYV
jgi:hypothetical protein